MKEEYYWDDFCHDPIENIDKMVTLKLSNEEYHFYGKDTLELFIGNGYKGIQTKKEED